MKKNVCAVWKIPCEDCGRRIAGDGFSQFSSSRAGGQYEISDSASALLATRQSIRTKLTSWIVDQHRYGVEWPLINTDVIHDVELRRPLRISEKVERFFEYLGANNYGLGSELTFYGDDPRDAMNGLAAWTECENDFQVFALLDLLRDDGLLLVDGIETRLTPEGFRRLEQISMGGAPTNQAFVAMWFSDDLQKAYDQGFDAAISAAGYRAMRIDRKEHNGKIDDEIIAEIKRSRFVVADFTCALLEYEGATQGIARGGVYYEAGFTQGIGTPLIWTVRSDCLAFVHFDTRQYAHIVWENPADLRKKLYNRIAAVIGEAPGALGLTP